MLMKYLTCHGIRRRNYVRIPVLSHLPTGAHIVLDGFYLNAELCNAEVTMDWPEGAQSKQSYHEMNASFSWKIKGIWFKQFFDVSLCRFPKTQYRSLLAICCISFGMTTEIRLD